MTSASRTVELQGSLAKFTLSDVVQLLSSSARTGKLGLIEGDSGRAGAIYFESGTVVHAEVGVSEGEDAFFDLMRWSDGGFIFRPDEVADKKTVRERSPVLLIESARRSDEWSVLAEHIPDTRFVPEFVLPEDSQSGRQINLNTSEWMVLSKIDGKRSLREVAREANLSEFHVCRLLYPLIIGKLIRLTEPAH
ncbi:MAG TPA: DUF4388 domain-containing protein [Vicinamibacteria bacterium]|nr:DUF4388 domain-containing protein [Vicinamibacteria bacterium]